MKIHNLNFEYKFEDRLPYANLEMLVDFLRSFSSKVLKFAVYGMGEAGLKVYDRCSNEKGIRLVACFDVNVAVAGDSVNILTPEHISDFPELDLIINTAPPQYLFDINKYILEQNAFVDVVNLYDVMDFLKREGNWDYLYKMLIKDQDLNGPLRAYHSEISKLIKIEKNLVLKKIKETRTRSPEVIKKELIRSQKCLGRHVECLFEEILSSKNDCVQKLLELANEYPFFSIARDAAATLLVKKGRFSDALKVFEPAIEVYPYCRLTLAKLSELKGLSGDLKGAERLATEALKMYPNSSETMKLLSDIQNGDVSNIKEKWENRTIRPALAARKVSLRCTTQVWGKDYINIFMELGLSSLLASGNIPHVAKNHDVCFSIYAYENEFDCIKSYPQWKAINSIIPVELVSIEATIEKEQAKNKSCDKYSHMTICQNDALALSAKDGRATFMPLADSFFANNFLKEAIEKLEMGYDTIFVTGIRASMQGFKRDLSLEFANGEAFEVPADDMLTAGIKNMHPFSSMSKDSRFTPLWPNYFIYEDESGSLLHSVFGNNPMFIASREKVLQIDGTLDSDFPYHVTDGGLGRYFFSDDSESMLLFEIVDERDDLHKHIKRQRCLKDAAFWLYGVTDPLSRFFGTRLMTYKKGDVSLEYGRNFAQAIEDTVEMVL